MAIGTTAALIGASVAGAAGQGIAASKAASAQKKAAKSQVELQRQMFDEQKEMFAPYLDTGNNALAAYQYEMGLGEMPEGYQGFTATPGYDFRLNQGLDAVNASVGARHGLNSGAALQALNEYGQDYATNEYGTYMNRLGGLMQQGQNSAAMSANAANNYATGASNAYANMGNASAAGYIGMGNALTGGINNGLAAWQYGQQQSSPITVPNSLVNYVGQYA